MSGESDIQMQEISLDQAAEMLNQGQIPADPEIEPEEEVASAEAPEEVEDGPEEAPEDDDSDEAEADDQEGPTWASVLGVNDDQVQLDEDGQLLITVKADGQEITRPFKEFVKSTQTEAYTTRITQELAEQRKEFDAKQAHVTQVVTEKLDQLNGLEAFYEQKILKDYASIDWDALKVSDPSSYVLKRQEFAEESNAYVQAKQFAAAERQKAAEQLSAQQAEAMNQALQLELQKVGEKRPEWANPDTRDEAIETMRGFLSSTYGLDDADFAEVKSAKAIDIILDAMAFHNAQKAAAPKLKGVPSFPKPGRNRDTSKARAVKSAKDRLGKSGRVDDAAALLNELFK